MFAEGAPLRPTAPDQSDGRVEVLDRRLDARVDDMMSRGLVDELADFHQRYNARRLQDQINANVLEFHLIGPIEIAPSTQLATLTATKCRAFAIQMALRFPVFSLDLIRLLLRLNQTQDDQSYFLLHIEIIQKMTVGGRIVKRKTLGV
ncbi:hypothetical protein OUZ56_009038 [Daphnia magna]|uniref:Uncharacterized protein n=1 Tax=Daphnia magna TaxID=35525 RepID=A0ABR0AF73_9CRUS|nr:hypothetical protein OUZ56_009038 [Daphnia magna]